MARSQDRLNLSCPPTSQRRGPCAISRAISTALVSIIALARFHSCPAVRTALSGETPPMSAAREKQNVAACIAVKDQHADVREWVEHHHGLGVSTFYVFDHASNPPLTEVLVEYIGEGIVQYAVFDEDCVPPGCRPQLRIYQTCLDKFRDKHQWMMFMDADEFVAFTNPDARLDTFLAEFRDAGALAVHWQTLGTSGFSEPPPGGLRANYHACLPWDHFDNSHVKLIANLRFTAGTAETPHELTYTHGRGPVNELSQPVSGPRSEPVSVRRIALYHYATKSLAEYRAKMRRGSAMGNHKGQPYLDHIERQATHNCTLLLDRARGTTPAAVAHLSATISVHTKPSSEPALL